MLFLSALFDSEVQHNSVNTVSTLLKIKGIKVASSTVKKTLREHSEYPSLLSISDALSSWKINNISLRSDIQQLATFPLPFIVQLNRGRGSYFSTVRKWENGQLMISDAQTTGWTWIKESDFEKSWKGVVMLLDVEENAGEAGFLKSRRKQYLNQMSYYAAISLLLGIWLISTFRLFVTQGIQAWAPASLLTLKLFGSYIGGLLLWYEIDKHNASLQKVCKAGKKINCQAILDSSAAKLLGIISWSETGFIYFAGGFIALIVAGMNPSTIILLAWLNAFALPYTLFSIYYQWRIAKQWCLLCITIQVLLVSEFIINVLNQNFKVPDITFYEALSDLVPFLLTATTWFLLKPLLILSKKSDETQHELTRMKRNPQIFESLLLREKSITHDPSGLGLSLGNPNGTVRLIKVCNPYCGPCAKSHTHIEDLIHKFPDLHVQIIFTASNSKDEPAAAPVKHLLAIDQKDKTLLKDALDDWYNAPLKNYETFAMRHVVNGELKQQDKKLDDMRSWCDNMKISFTPTFFFNGHQLPKSYHISDLQHFLE
jgi:uncharacterized membrane protein